MNKILEIERSPHRLLGSFLFFTLLPAAQEYGQMLPQACSRTAVEAKATKGTGADVAICVASSD